MRSSADIARARGIERVVHFHTDHFEPTTGASIDCVRRYLEAAATRPFAARGSLFYLLEAFRFDEAADAFVATERHDEDIATRAQLILAGADVHVHIHHEGWAASPWPPEPTRDAVRLDRYLSLLNEAWLLPKRWGFIHGKWALNGSDPDVCCIADEIQILMKHGGVADFSFPAGRGYCDPLIKHPLDIRPISAVRSYDDDEADPKEVTGVVRPGHFLVWNSRAIFPRLSLEHVCQAPAAAPIVATWLDDCPVIGVTLYVRTFCHAMNPAFWKPGAVTPMLTPRVAEVFAGLERACDEAGVPLAYQTASEVLDALVPA